jgi:hypothetical protein
VSMQIIYLMTLCLPLVTILLVFGMRYVASTQQARARLADESAYRRLAEQATNAGNESARALSTIEAALADVRVRLAAIEHVLKTVE